MKSQLQQMKLLKPFTPSLYSEFLLGASSSLLPTSSHQTAPLKPTQPIDLLALGSNTAENELPHTAEPVQPHPNGQSSADDPTGLLGDSRGPGGEGKGRYDRGLGEVFGYPGDARKLREKSKVKLWKDYFAVHGRNLTCKCAVFGFLYRVFTCDYTI